MKKIYSAILKMALLLIAFLIIAESLLRVLFGLGKPPLMVADKNIGYLYKANQNLRRFGNKIMYNEFHQRSDKLLDEFAYRVLIIGDSIVNGGQFTDQKDTIAEILERKLNACVGSKGEVLNASAKSWGLENEYEYVKKFGIFNADIVIIQAETSDFATPKATEDKVGTPSHPSHNYFLAIEELLAYSRKSNIPKKNTKTSNLAEPINIAKIIADRNIDSLLKLTEIIKKEGSSCLVLLVPKKVESEGERIVTQKFVNVLKKHNLNFINLADKKYNIENEYFKDNIHFNEKGRQYVSDILFDFIIENKPFKKRI